MTRLPRSASPLLLLPLGLALLAVGLAGCGGLGMQAPIEPLRAMGLRVLLDTDGWVRLRAPEGYSVAMPGVPAGETEDFHFAGHAIRGRFLDLNAVGSSRGFLFRSFDARALEPEEREALRMQALRLFLPRRARVAEVRTLNEGGVRVEQQIAEGYSSVNGHEGVIRSFVRGGFVFQMLVISTAGGGLSGDALTFFRSVRLEEPAPGEEGVSVDLRPAVE